MNDYQKIIDIIQNEVSLFEELIEVMNKKKEYLISLSIEDLHKTINEEIKIIAKTKYYENQRLELFKIFFPQRQKVENIPFSDLIKEAPEKESKILSNLKRVLNAKYDEIKRINETNKLLIERSKKFIKENISILTCAGERQLVNKKV